MQTGKSRMMPLVLMDRPGGAVLEDVGPPHPRAPLRNGFISPDDLHLYRSPMTSTKPCASSRASYRNYHSMRFVHELLVIRLKHAPSQHAIDGLNQDFKTSSAAIQCRPSSHA
jgi:hypothetical protein